MKNIINKRLRFFIMVFVLFLIINITISLAYITGTPKNAESVSTVALKSGSFSIIYSSSKNSIEISNISPGFQTTKQFTVKSNFGNKYNYYNNNIGYYISLVVNRNEFDDDSINYSLLLDENSSKSGITAVNSYDIGINHGSNTSGILIGTGVFFEDNISHVYNLKISYRNKDDDQSHEIGCKFDAYVLVQAAELLSVNVNLDGGHFSDAILNREVIDLPKNSVLHLPIPSKENYIFQGWSVNGVDAYIRNSHIYTGENSFTLTANWGLDASVPLFTFTGSYEIVDDDNNVITDTSDWYDNWKIRFLSSGTLVFNQLSNNFSGIDIFVVGGGGNGAKGSKYFSGVSRGGGGGGGGASITVTKFLIEKNVEYNVVVGDAISDSSFGKGNIDYFTALHGTTPSQPTYINGSGTPAYGGAGGEGRLSGQTGNYGAESVIVNTGGSGNGRSGSGTKLTGDDGTYEFNGTSGIRYGAGGGSGGDGVSTGTGGSGNTGKTNGNDTGGGNGGRGCYTSGVNPISGSRGSAGTANTGSGGGGGGGNCGSASADNSGTNPGSGGSGASGIVIIRNTR